MNEDYEHLFKILDFEKIRNTIFEELNKDIENFINDNDYKDLNDIKSKFVKYRSFKKSEIIYSGFKFEIYGNVLYFFHKDYEDKIFIITDLKKFSISKNPDGSLAQEEWVFNESYLMFLVSKVYEIENPKIAHSFQSIQDLDSNSIITLKEEDVNTYMKNDWNVIYASSYKIDYDKILNLKNIKFKERENVKFFLNLYGFKNLENLPKDYTEYKAYCTSFNDIFSKCSGLQKKNIIFHNEDSYFRFNFFQLLEIQYNWGNFFYLYINFELFKKYSRYEKLEIFFYFLSFMFPDNFEKLSEFFEKDIKYLLSDNLGCWHKIINNIINFFQENIFKEKDSQSIEKLSLSKETVSQSEDKISQSKEKVSKEEEKKDIFHNSKNLIDEANSKKFIIIFDNIKTEEETNVVENIIENCSDSHFIFFIIYPLINEFNSKQLIKYIYHPYDDYSPFSLFLLNFNNFNSKSPQYYKNVNSKIFTENDINNDKLFYDLLRIFNFKYLFVDSINNDNNSKSLDFLTGYIKYLNLQFDNKNKKIINVSFKNEMIEKEFKNVYEYVFDLIKTNNSFLFNNLIGQRDAFDLEKIIISTIIFRKRENFEVLQLKSIFGLKDLKKEKNIDYEKCNFILKQESSTGEMFDFGFKIIKDNKQYLKLPQITSDKTDEEKKKICIERMKINFSYLKKEFEENGLGKLDGISFCIISPLSIGKDKTEKNYKDLEEFCDENNYQFLFFDFNKLLFHEGFKKNYIETDLFDIDDKYQLNILNFNEIISIDKSLQILSIRNVKGRDITKEDMEAKEEAKKYMRQNIERVAKFEYKGSFYDLKRLNTNYFGFIYFQKKISAYFYNKEIIKTFGSEANEIDNNKDKDLILILYGADEEKKNQNQKNNETSEKNEQNLEAQIEIDEEQKDYNENSGFKKGKKKKKTIFKIDKEFLGKKREKNNE